MRIGLFAAALALLTGGFTPTARLAAADPPVVFQTQPVGRLLDDTRAAASLVAGDRAVKEINDGIKQKLGDKGFAGLDLTRPVVGYVTIPAEPKESVVVVALPVTNEKEFLDFCERWNKSKPKALEGGLYEVPPPGPDAKAVMRFADGYAYIAAADKDPARALVPKALVPVAKLHDPADPASGTLRVYFDRLPKELRDKAAAALDEAKKAVAAAPLPEGASDAAKSATEQFSKLATRYIDLSKGAKEAALRLNLDAGTADVSAEVSLVPVAGSPLAGLLGGMKPTTNAFAGFVTPETVFGFRGSLPLFAEEIRVAAADGLEAARKQTGNNLPPPINGLADELLKGLGRTVKAGDVDVAAVMRGPAKDGTYTGVAALVFDDPSGVEKELKKVIDAFAPPEFKNALKWDAEKVGKVSIHTIDISKVAEGGDAAFIPPGTLFGPKAVFAFVFAPKAVYAAIGSDAIGTIKAAMALKPGESPVLDVVLNPARVSKFAGAIDPAGAAGAEKILGKDDQLVSAVSLTVAGGKELRVKLGLNLRLFGSLFVARTGSATATPAPPPAK